MAAVISTYKAPAKLLATLGIVEADELDIEAIDDLCRSLHRSTNVLAEMLNAKGGAQR